MPRKKTGQAIEWRSQMKTWVGRVRGYPEGHARGLWLSLGTDDKAAAQRRYDEWLATGEPPKEARAETFEEAALRIVAAMPEETDTQKKKKQARGQRLRDYAFSILGHLEAWRVEGKHIASVLDRMPALGKKKGTIAYVRTDLSQVLAKLIREGARTDNPAREFPLPPEAVEDGRLRCVLTDDEVCRFRDKRGFETTLDMACLFARDLGGHRTSDLLAARYEHVDWQKRTIKVRRPKTDREGKLVGVRKPKSYELVTHGIPDSVWGPLGAWHAAHGSPLDGPIFPVTRSCRGGRVKRKDGRVTARRSAVQGGERVVNGAGFVKPLRRALWEAGIHRPLPGWDPAAPDPRFDALQTDTDETRAVDFHSMRRAFVTALKDAKVPLPDILALCGHTSLATSSKYDTARHVQVPDAALPRQMGAPRAPIKTKGEAGAAPTATATTAEVPASPADLSAVLAQLAELQKMLTPPRTTPAQSVSEGGNDPDSGSYTPGPLALTMPKPSESFVEPTGIEPVTCALRTQNQPVAATQLLGMTENVRLGATAAEGVSTQSLGQTIAAAAEAGDWELVEELTAIAKRRSQAPLAPVHKLSDARKRRG